MGGLGRGIRGVCVGGGVSTKGGKANGSKAVFPGSESLALMDLKASMVNEIEYFKQLF